ncbi:MAG: hypothetical protein K8W52_09330 [Deltaproteobacteria bacterium]|nr:hypothetical protein [Deltaproteobacteria bacterium]
MKKLAFGALFIGLLTAACGGGSSSNADAKIIVTADAAQPDGSVAACNVTAQTGCDPGEKCTWIRVAASTTQQLGQLGCVPDGTVALDGACMYGAAGTATGYDNCQKGLVCLANSTVDSAAGSCRTICDLAAVAPAAGACPTNYGCGAYINLFANGSDTAVAGVCDPTCDPLTQIRDTDQKAACGSTDPANPNRGCYGYPSSDATPTEFRCSGAGDLTFGAGHLLPVADAYLNACAPGFIPLFYASTTDHNNVVCTGFCAPGDTNSTAKANAGGKVGSGHTCQDGGADAAVECRYLWAYEDATTPLTKYSHGVGVCFDYSKFTYDDDQNAATPNVPNPSCTELATGADAISWGCEDVQTRPAFKSKVPFRSALTAEQVETLKGSWN